jgi:glycosyltransferase involved in cell wall biosynthesis
LAEFDRERLNHYVCCVTTGGVYESRLRDLDIPYRICTRRARFDPAVIQELASLMRVWKIDIVHTRNFTANSWGRVAARIARVPRIIAHERGTAWTESALMRWTDRCLGRFTDVLLANSRAAYTILTQLVHIPPDLIRIVYNGVPMSAAEPVRSGPLRAEIGLAANTPLIGTVGRLDTPKGLPFLVRTIPHVLDKRPATHFVIIGDGPLGAYLAGAVGDNDNVHLLGYRPDAPTLMQELNVLLHPAIREPLGNVLMEAGASGVPVVATAVDGIPEVILDGETGLLIPGTEAPVFIPATGASSLPAAVVDGQTGRLRRPLGPAPERLAEALVALLDDPDQQAAMGRRARDRVRAAFSLARYVQDVSAIYLGQSGDPPEQ